MANEIARLGKTSFSIELRSGKNNGALLTLSSQKRRGYDVLCEQLKTLIEEEGGMAVSKGAKNNLLIIQPAEARSTHQNGTMETLVPTDYPQGTDAHVFLRQATERVKRAVQKLAQGVDAVRDDQPAMDTFLALETSRNDAKVTAAAQAVIAHLEEQGTTLTDDQQAGLRAALAKANKTGGPHDGLRRMKGAAINYLRQEELIDNTPGQTRAQDEAIKDAMSSALASSRAG